MDINYFKYSSCYINIVSFFIAVIIFVIVNNVVSDFLFKKASLKVKLGQCYPKMIQDK